MRDRNRLAPDAGRRAGPETAPRAAAIKPSPRILCIDDEPLFLRSLERFLSRAGYRTFAFENPDEALQELARVSPDLAILDVRMPVMNGLDVADEIQESLDRPIPVILLSALCGDADMIRAYRRGHRFYAIKPCHPPELLELIEEALRAGRAAREDSGSA